jgi:septin family protein
MSLIETYRANALAQRAAAEKTDLVNRKAMHERSAQTWEEMARGAEETAIRAAINHANKVASAP